MNAHNINSSPLAFTVQRALASGRPTRPPLRRETESDAMATGKTVNATPATAQSRANAHAERTASREQRLRAHPHADVRGPELVACRLCGQQIKLSTKSAYDAFHWNKHIERCARRAPSSRKQGVMRAAERKKRSRIAKDNDHQLEKRTILTIRLRSKPNGERTVVAEPESVASVEVKEESSERDIDVDGPSSPRSRSSPLLVTPSPPRTTEPFQPEPDIMMEEYYRRSRRRGTRDLSPFTLEAASTWTWSQVKEPVWVVRNYPSSESLDSDDSPNGRKRGTTRGGVLGSSVGDDEWSKRPLAVRAKRLDAEPSTSG